MLLENCHTILCTMVKIPVFILGALMFACFVAILGIVFDPEHRKNRDEIERTKSDL